MMLANLAWQQPWWLPLALAPWLARAWLRRRGGDAFADAHLLKFLLTGDGTRARAWRLPLAWLLAALAAAGPYWRDGTAPPPPPRGVDLAVIVDISPSMSAADVTPTRLARIKLELRDMVEMLAPPLSGTAGYTSPLTPALSQREERKRRVRGSMQRVNRLGLIVYSANAYIALPLTTDTQTFLDFVDMLDPSLTALHGSNMARALEQAQEALAGSGEDSRAALLISDGEFHGGDALAAARALAARDIPLFTLGAGTPAGAPVPDEQGSFVRDGGEIVIARLNAPALQELARAAGGDYFTLRDDDGEWRDFARRLRAATRAAEYPAQALPPGAVPLFAWPLAASLVLFLWHGAQRARGLALLLIVPFLFAPALAPAAPWDEQRAFDALQHGDLATAEKHYRRIDTYNGWMGQGAAAYRAQKWEAARAAYEHAAQHAASDDARAHALYNSGNALAQSRRFEESSRRYQEALKLVPGFFRASMNLALVQQFLDARHTGARQRDNAPHTTPDADTGGEQDKELSRTRAGQEHTDAPVPPQGHAQNPQQRRGGDGAALHETLTLWTSGANNTGDALDTIRDNNAGFLRQRFDGEDRRAAALTRDKPW